VDWKTIKTEYITDESSSYRKLAKKYGVSYSAIGDKARKEGWLEEREQYQTKTLSKTLTAISNGQAKRASRLQTVADKLLDKIEAAVDNFDMAELLMDKQALKQITGALKDIKDIQMIKSEADLREQDARIRNLEKQAEAEEKVDNEIKVTIECDLEQYSK
jgi:transcriptional regulator of aromatic amino acid metabolism